MKYLPKVIAFIVCALVLMSFNASTQSKKSTNDYNLQRAYEVLREDGDEQQALKLISEQLKLTPNDARAYLLRARILRGQESFGDALAAVNSAIKVNKPKASGIKNSTLVWWKAIIYKDMSELEQSVKYFDEALKMARKDNKENVQDISFDYAQVLYFLKRYSDADALYYQMLRDDETDVSAMVGLARTMIKNDDCEGAKQMLLKSLKYEDEYSEAYKYLMRAYSELGEKDDAIDAALKYIELDEDADSEEVVEAILKHKSYGIAKVRENVKHGEEPLVWRYLLTDVYETTEEYDLAIKEYDAIESDFGKSPQINYYRSQCYSGLGLNALALSELEKCMDDDDPSAKFIDKKAYYLRELGEYDDAIEVIDELIDMVPTLGYAYYQKGLNYEMKGDLDSAYDWYSEGIDIDDDYPYLYLMRGEILLKRGETDKAMSDFEEIVKRDTTLESGSCRHYALHFLGKDDEAMAWMDSLIVKYENEPGQYYDKTCLLSMMGKLDESVKAMGQAFEHGYARFVHMDNDDDLDLIRDREDFRTMVAEAKAKLQKKIEKMGLDVEPQTEDLIVEVPIVRRNGGTFDVECQVNGLPLSMIFDTGASDVTISKVEADFMLKNKYLSQSDIKGKQYYQIANGDISEGTVINLKEVRIGGAVLKNVNASVVKNQKAPLLLGESVLSKFGTFTVDNINSKLIIKQ
ncbi:MAG: TIGR02281 family clan AA aspartic protease [Bacteroidales bacterium]|nr:TIGR02281 family clan AA aspartic protease [Bacteroidales bacterium]